MDQAIVGWDSELAARIKGFVNILYLRGKVETVAFGVVCAAGSIRVKGPKPTCKKSNRGVV